jgi:hypothetical protein
MKIIIFYFKVATSETAETQVEDKKSQDKNGNSIVLKNCIHFDEF